MRDKATTRRRLWTRRKDGTGGPQGRTRRSARHARKLRKASTHAPPRAHAHTESDILPRATHTPHSNPLKHGSAEQQKNSGDQQNALVPGRPRRGIVVFFHLHVRFCIYNFEPLPAGPAACRSGAGRGLGPRDWSSGAWSSRSARTTNAPANRLARTPKIQGKTWTPWQLLVGRCCATRPPTAPRREGAPTQQLRSFVAASAPCSSVFFGPCSRWYGLEGAATRNHGQAQEPH